MIEKILKLFKKKNKSVSPYQTAAFHEAGHAVLGYHVGFEVVEIKLSTKDVGDGSIIFNYGEDHFLIAVIREAKNLPEFHEMILKHPREKILKICLEILLTVIGGPAAEAINEYGLDYSGGLEISGPDNKAVEGVEYVLYLIKYNDSDCISESIAVVMNLLKNKKCWVIVKKLSEKLIDSPNLILKQSQIELVFKESNFMRNKKFTV